MSVAQHVSAELLRAGDVVRVGPFSATIYPDFDFETYCEAGYEWNPPEPPEFVEGKRGWRLKEHLGKWGSLPGLSDTNRGLKAVGVRNYVQHPTFSILSLRYDLKDGKGRRRFDPGLSGLWSPVPYDLLEHVRSGGPIEAFNIDFEWTVWNFYCVPVLGWPELKLEQMRCAMAKSRASAYPGAMADVGEVLFRWPEDKHLMKDPAGEKLIKKLTVPKNPTKGNPALRWTPMTAPADFEKLYAYNEQDIVAEAAISQRVPDLTSREMEVWRTHFRINARGMQVALWDVENCICIVEQGYAKYNTRLSELTGGAVRGSTEVAKILAWMASKHGIHLSELDEETVEEALKRSYPAEVLEVLRIRQLLAFGSVRKLFAFRSHSTPQGRLHDQYIYYGAHTGLWNGRAVQPANLYKGMFSKPDQVETALQLIATRRLDIVEAAYGDALELVANCLRSMIVARPGTRLISADFTAIQAVVTAALAGEEWRLDVFRSHGMIYEAQASMMTGTPLQYYIEYKRDNKKHHSDRQDYGKLPVLSGDFGAWIPGWKRFGAEKVLGEDANIKAAILKLRDTIPNIVELWGGQTRSKFKRDERPELYGLEGAAISAVLSPGQCFGYRGISYQMFEDILYCRPPSGGFIRYHKPRLQPSTRDYACPWELELTYWGWNSNATKGKAGWREMKLYGGVLTQNSVSHVAREVQADALMALESGHLSPLREQYPVVMHTHDEQVAEKEEGRGSTADYTHVVRASLADWARTPDGRPWPIKVPEAWEAYRYGKWED